MAAWLEQIEIVNARVGRGFFIDLRDPAGGRPRHLILTGPNGSGKTSALQAIWSEMLNMAQGRSPGQQELRARSLGEPSALPPENVRAIVNGGVKIECIYRLHFGSVRRLSPSPVDGPRADHMPSILGEPSLHNQFVQFLINRRTELAFANEDGDAATAQRLRDWFEQVRRTLAAIVEDPGLTLLHDRAKYSFRLQFTDGRVRAFDQLPDGHQSLFVLITDLLQREQAARIVHGRPAEEMPAIVLVDEIDAHLHPRLQTRILPLLAGLFPGVQWIVATHAPAILPSLPHTLVYDLGTGEGTPSEDLMGLHLGTVYTAHFGLPSDFDLDSAQRLDRLRLLSALPTRSPAEEAERAALAAALSARSAPLAMEVWALSPGTGLEAAR